MANTQYIRKSVEPYIRAWLSKKCGGVKFSEKEVYLGSGVCKFDAVSSDRTIVAAFVCNRPKTVTGKENTGGVRKALNDLQLLNLLPTTVDKRLFVFTNREFLALIRKRGERVGVKGIEFVYCELPKRLAAGLEKVLNYCRQEQINYLKG